MKVNALGLAALITSGCSGVEFNTNLGPYASSRVKAATVQEYTPEEINRYDAVSLGFVEASDCQKRVDDSEPSKRGLLNAMKIRAHTLGGNGLVVEACGRAQTAGCLVYMECRGTAYSVPERQSRP